MSRLDQHGLEVMLANIVRNLSQEDTVVDITEEDLEEVEGAFYPNQMRIPTFITPEELQQIEDAFVVGEPTHLPIPEVMTGDELESVENTFNPRPYYIEPLSPQDLQDIKDAFVIIGNNV